MKNNQKTVVIGLSGGVDSAVAALLLKKKGYKVIAAFMKNFSDTKNPLTGDCSYLEEKKMAQRVASKLKIPFVVFDFEKEYKNLVMDQMYKDYQKGLTPNPDISCNTIIKFPLFWEEAKKLGADYIAIGHYARIKKVGKEFQLFAGKDKSKDQSYFLYELSQQDLSHTLFPIGNLTKEEVRKTAKSLNFPNWNKKSTRGICFVGKVNMISFLSKKIKKSPGKVITPEGKTIGTHDGVQYYTIGQKVGPHLGIEIKKEFPQEKYYIADKLKNNKLVVAPNGHPSLKKQEVKLINFHLINQKERVPKKLKARIRHLGILHSGNFEKENQGYKFNFDRPLEAIAPGQSLVLYYKNRVIGGGQIAK